MDRGHYGHGGAKMYKPKIQFCLLVNVGMWKPDQKSGATSESWKEKTVLAINSGCTVVIGNVPKYTLYNLIL